MYFVFLHILGCLFINNAKHLHTQLIICDEHKMYEDFVFISPRPYNYMLLWACVP